MAQGARRPQSPKRQLQQERHIKILICTEGAVTEPQYFEGISIAGTNQNLVRVGS